MGHLISRFITRCFGKREIRMLMVGMDAAGKTTILYMLRLGEVVTTIPTIGFNVENITHDNITFTVWDVSVGSAGRGLYRHYYRDTTGLIFVVDSCDRDRLDQAREGLFMHMNDEELRDCLLLVFANKQDLPNAMSISEMTEKLGLSEIKQTWHIQPSSAIKGEGLKEGFTWLAEALQEKQRYYPSCINLN